MTHVLVLRLEKLARTERKITDQIIKTLIEIEEQKIHLKMGYGSIFTFLVQHLGYSESAAQRRNVAMKLYKKAPEISEKLQEGSLNLTQIAELERVTRQIPTEQILEVIPKIENKNTHQTQHIIAKEFDLPAIQHEKTRTQKDESVRMQITLSKEQYEVFKKAEDLLSHVKPGATYAEVITMLAQKFMKQKLGKDFDTKNTAATAENTVKAPKQVSTAATKVTSIESQNQFATAATNLSSLKTPTTSNIAPKAKLKSKRKPISIKTKRILLKKAHHQCEFVSSTGQRCKANSMLEIDHIQPVSLGGQNDVQNLRIYCRAHNQAREAMD